MRIEQKSFFRSTKISRRSFLKVTATLGAGVALGSYASSKRFYPNRLFAPVEAAQEPQVKLVKTICSYCAVGCGLKVRVEDGVVTGQEPWEDHPINQGGLCCKGASQTNVITHMENRIRYPMKKEGGQWKRITWDDALNEIANKLDEVRRTSGPEAVYWLGSAKFSNEEAYYFRKLAAFWGTNNIDHQARICHSTTVAGLGNTWGYGAETNNFNDMANTRCALIIGSNFVEQHPVGFRYLLDARQNNGAIIIVADPRFTKTAAKADKYVRFRPGTDIAILNGLANVIIEEDLVDKDFIDKRTYGYDYVKEVVKDYTPEVVEDISWVKADDIRYIARTMAAKRPSTIVYSMGSTQHTVGTQNIRSYAILQLLLGNAGKLGGGVNALRGHDNVQGATDMCILSHHLPSYYGLSKGAWGHWSKVWGVDYEYMVSRFESEEAMGNKGYTDARFYEGINKGDIKVLFVWGHNMNSQAVTGRQKEALEKVELLVVVDIVPNAATALPDRRDGTILLPASSRSESKGSVTNSGRQVQWRFKAIDPLYESKPDLEIMKLLAEKIGLGKYFNKSPEDILKEINLGARAISMRQSPERLKRQAENSHLFSQDTVKEFGAPQGIAGPVKGEFWGLPWPCWNDEHPGTPILYRNEIPVAEGGHDFRAKWGTEAPDGATLLEAEIGHAELNPDGTPGPGWKLDLTTDYKGLIAANKVPYGRGRARINAWNLPDNVPIHREPIESPRKDLIVRYPTYEDWEAGYRVATKYKSAVDSDTVDTYPIILTTGRLGQHHCGGTYSRSTNWLVELMPEMFVEINPATAAEKGIKDGDMVWVESKRGRVHVKAKVTNRVNEKEVFMPFHWAGVFQGESLKDRYPEEWAPLSLGDSANICTIDAYDRVTQMPETKVCLCKVYK